MEAVAREIGPQNDMRIIEGVLIGGDLSNLSQEQRLTYYRHVCESVGLNPFTKPFDYIVLNGKLVLYPNKGCTDQLRNIHDVSVKIVSRETINDCYVVTAQAAIGARTDESIGAVSIGKKSGEDICNAIMKAETKAKRRATLSICGLGMLDESELETISETDKADSQRPVAPSLPRQPEINYVAHLGAAIMEFVNHDKKAATAMLEELTGKKSLKDLTQTDAKAAQMLFEKNYMSAGSECTDAETLPGVE